MPGRYGAGLLGGGGYDPLSSSTDGLFPRPGRGNLDPVPGTVGPVPGAPVSTTMPVPGPGGLPSPQLGAPSGGLLGLPGMGGGNPMGSPQNPMDAGAGLQRGAIMDALKQYIGGGRGA